MEWSKLLFTYGPFSLLALFIFVVENKARLALKSEAPAPKWVPVGVYSLTWLAIFALGAVVTVVWIDNNRSEATIVGRLENLQGQESISSRNEHLYLRRVYDGPNGRYDYSWRIITNKPLQPGARLPFYFDRGVIPERVTKHDLVIQESFYAGPVTLVYERETDQIVLISADGRQALPSTVADRAPAPVRTAGLLPTLFAAPERPPEALAKQLEASDPIVRHEARQALAGKRAAALPMINDILENPDSSYRLQLGAIVALRDIAHAKAMTSLTPRAQLTLVAAAAGPDPTLRQEADAFVKRYMAASSRVQGSARLELSPRGSGMLTLRSPVASGDWFRCAFRFEKRPAGDVLVELSSPQALSEAADGQWAFRAFVDERPLATFFESVPGGRGTPYARAFTPAGPSATLRVVGLKVEK